MVNIKENKISGDQSGFVLDVEARQRLIENAKKVREAAIRQRAAESKALPFPLGKTLFEKHSPGAYKLKKGN